MFIPPVVYTEAFAEQQACICFVYILGRTFQISSGNPFTISVVPALVPVLSHLMMGLALQLCDITRQLRTGAHGLAGGDYGSFFRALGLF